MSNEDKMIGKAEVCKLLGVHSPTFDRWLDPKSRYHKSDLPRPRRDESGTTLWNLQEIIDWRDLRR